MAKSITATASSQINDSGTLSGIETKANAALASLLSHTILDFNFAVQDATRFLGVELSITVEYDAAGSGATITNPYKLKVFQDQTMASVLTAAQTWIAARQGIAFNFWIGPVRTQYAPGIKGSTKPYFIAVLYNESATDGAKNFPMGRPIEFLKLKTTTPATSRFYAGGFYQAPAADANLNQGSLTQTLGSASQPYGAHVFIVAKQAGTVDTGTVGIRVSGKSLADDGTINASDTETLSADITALTANLYLETTKRWVDQVTLELYTVDGSPTTYAADFNYGFAKYQNFNKTDFILDMVEVVGQAGANDANFDIIVLKHSDTGWTYSAAAFVPGGSEILAQLTTDFSSAALVSGEHYCYRRDGLNEVISGASQEGVLIVILTPNDANALGNDDITIGATVLS